MTDYARLLHFAAKQYKFTPGETASIDITTLCAMMDVAAEDAESIKKGVNKKPTLIDGGRTLDLRHASMNDIKKGFASLNQRVTDNRAKPKLKE